MHHNHTFTTYYVTFEVESGDRMELHVSGQEYGLLVEYKGIVFGEVIQGINFIKDFTVGLSNFFGGRSAWWYMHVAVLRKKDS